MRIVIDSTDQLVPVEGVPCRIWKGTTEEGVDCVVFVHRLVPECGQEAQFERELKHVPGAPHLDDVLRKHLPVVHRTP